MYRRVFLLMGLAIIAVVCNHAAGWGYTAMFWWTDRYRPVTVPNFDQMGSLPYYGLSLLKQLTVFAVPVFLFVSGFFISYASRGRKSGLGWKTARVRIVGLLLPFIIWSRSYSSSMRRGMRYSPGEYLHRLVFGNATPAYWYIPVICQLYLLSPLLVPIAKTRWRLLLSISGLLTSRWWLCCMYLSHR